MTKKSQALTRQREKKNEQKKNNSIQINKQKLAGACKDYYKKKLS